LAKIRVQRAVILAAFAMQMTLLAAALVLIITFKITLLRWVEPSGSAAS